MAVKITDTCINCAACIDECPVEAIVDNDDNPTDNDYYYVYTDRCVECVDHYTLPACAEACPTDECIEWGDKGEVNHKDREEGEPVFPD